MSVWGLVGSLLGAGGAYASQERTNRFNAQQASLNRSFQQEMRNTQWQAGVADMEAAGLNPALAYQQGPNAAPGGATASANGDPGSSALQALMARKQLKLLDEQISKTQGEATIAKSQGRLQAEREKKLLETYGVDGDRFPSLFDRLISAEADQADANVSGARALARRNSYLADIAGIPGSISSSLLTNFGAPGHRVDPWPSAGLWPDSRKAPKQAR